MAANDVVKHELKVSDDDSWIEGSVPVPMPVVPERLMPPTMMSGGPPVTTRVPSQELTELPFCSVGKFFMMFDKKGYDGSGWVVTAHGIITAGHIVYNTDLIESGWATSGLFYPHYVPGSMHRYTARTLYTLQGWIDDSEDTRYDLGAAVMTTKFTTDELPLLWDLDAEPFDYLAIGYPAVPIPNYDFNGQRMWKCAGEAIGRVNGLEWAMNNLTEGASGGPWWDPEDRFVVGINAGRKSDINRACSPIFGQGLQNLYDAVRSV